MTLPARRPAAVLAAALSLTAAAPLGAAALSTVAVGTAVLAAPADAAPVQGGDGLEQDVAADEAASDERSVFDHGHLDMGPRMVDGEWTLQLRDDSEGTPVWREPENTVIAVPDESLTEVPDDPAYSFVEAEPGQEVYVLPQVEQQGIPWPGWNTQHPSALKEMGRGARFTLEAVDGPGTALLYLEPGTFDPPQVLWDSRKATGGTVQDFFAEANTHTHANWVFTEPGVYTFKVRVTAENDDDRQLTDDALLRVAVGSDTDPETAYDAPAPENGGAGGDGARTDAGGDAQDTGGTDVTPALLGAGAGVLLLGGAGVAVWTASRRKHEAKA